MTMTTTDQGDFSLRIFRLQSGMTQRQLGELLGVDQTIVSRLERRQYHATPSLLRKVSGLTGVPLAKLMERMLPG
jgi:transcriptional regulator with XRE-family HTH domain